MLFSFSAAAKPEIPAPIIITVFYLVWFTTCQKRRRNQ
jgi:hypothetical protein